MSWVWANTYQRGRYRRFASLARFPTKTDRLSAVCSYRAYVLCVCVQYKRTENGLAHIDTHNTEIRARAAKESERENSFIARAFRSDTYIGMRVNMCVYMGATHHIVGKNVRHNVVYIFHAVRVCNTYTSNSIHTPVWLCITSMCTCIHDTQTQRYIAHLIDRGVLSKTWHDYCIQI